MAFKVFITGITGYIAGDATYALVQAHPEYDYTFLIRTQEKADVVKKQYPKARIVIGDLDDSELLIGEAAKADVVIHAADASDNEGAAYALVDGMISGHSKDHPGFYLHTGGTGILTLEDAKAGHTGAYRDKQYDDWEGVKEITSLPDEAFHRNVDKIVLEAGSQHSDVLKTAIICPPTIYGTGRGPSSTRGRQVYELSKMILQHSITPIFGEGKARWSHIHVADLSDVYVALVEAAAKKDLNSELWGQNGYYFTEDGEHYWSELARDIGKQAVKLGYVASAKEEVLAKEDAEKQAGWEGISWTTTSIVHATRARKLLGWSPKQRSLELTIPDILAYEHKRIEV